MVVESYLRGYATMMISDAHVDSGLELTSLMEW